MGCFIVLLQAKPFKPGGPFVSFMVKRNIVSIMAVLVMVILFGGCSLFSADTNAPIPGVIPSEFEDSGDYEDEGVFDEVGVRPCDSADPS